jgi:hypothetical protein
MFPHLAANTLGFMMQSRYRHPLNTEQGFYEVDKTRFPTGYPEMAFTIKNYVSNDGLFNTTDYWADTHYMNVCPIYASEYSFEKLLKNERVKPDGVEPIVFEMTRAQNSIAKTTRRGRGQHMIMPTHTLKKMQPILTKYSSILTGKVTEYPTNSKKDWIFVYYRGANPIDVPGLLIGNRFVPQRYIDSNAPRYDYGRIMQFI